MKMLVPTAMLLLLCGCREPNTPSGSTASEASPGQPAIPAEAHPGTANYEQASMCNIEMLAGIALGAEVVALDTPADVRGWLADDAGRIPGTPALVLAGEDKVVAREIPIQLVIPRPDVVKAYPTKQGLESSGFQISVDPRGIAPGKYHLYLTFTSPDHKKYICDNGRYVQISD
jgi:hypothetical protein